MRVFGLIGYPLTHSFSQKYFSEKFERQHITGCRYENFSIPSIGEFPATLLTTPGLEGLNVTIPYKEAILRYLDEQTEAVRQIGACNCIQIGGGKLTGYNTDAIGFEKTLLEKLLPQHDGALILGTGGAAKAVEFVLKKLGIRCRYVSRRPSDRLLKYEQLDPVIIQQNKLIINTTPLGMYPDTRSAPPIPYQYLTAEHLLYDLIYNPQKTVFLEKGEAQGAAILNGSGMLIIQAEESWNIWNGLKAC